MEILGKFVAFFCQQIWTDISFESFSVGWGGWGYKLRGRRAEGWGGWGLGLRRDCNPRWLLEEGGKGERVAPICQLWTCGGGWSGYGGIVEEGKGGSIQCMQFHFSYISPPTNQQTHPHQDTKIGIFFPAAVYLKHNCNIFISVLSGCWKCR